MRASIHDAGEKDFGILSEAKARASISANGKDAEVSFLALIFLFRLCFFSGFVIVNRM